MSARYRKKPVVIEAVKYDGDNDREVIAWTGGYGSGFVDRASNIRLVTREGDIKAAPGDWIIKGVKGEFSVCKPDDFDATYEPA